jgi:peptide/nickel transport system permease protein
MFAMTMRGIQKSFTVMITIGVLATLIGVIIGSISGYFGGKVDMVLMRFTDMYITIPVLIIGAVLGKLANGASAFSLGFCLAFVSWTTIARLVRAEILRIKNMEYIDAAKISGASSIRIIRKHILPNIIGVIIVNCTLLMSSAILLETSLSYLGFGIQYPDISLGNLISEYQSSFADRPWLFWWPGLFIIIIALSVNFIGDGLRDAYDPRQGRILSAKKMARIAQKKAKALALNGVKGLKNGGA